MGRCGGAAKLSVVGERGKPGWVGDRVVKMGEFLNMKSSTHFMAEIPIAPRTSMTASITSPAFPGPDAKPKEMMWSMQMHEGSATSQMAVRHLSRAIQGLLQKHALTSPTANK